MRVLLSFVAGLCTVACAVVLFLWIGGLSATRRQPWPLESRVAAAVWRAFVPGRIRNAANPVPATAEVLTAARAHWADHCALCHANDGSGDTPVGRRVYPRPPDMRAETVQKLTDGELFYAIEQGIPWTAMPGWATGIAEGERDSWSLVRLIRHLPSITPDELSEMERLNPKPPPNAAREKEIEDFLKGR